MSIRAGETGVAHDAESPSTDVDRRGGGSQSRDLKFPGEMIMKADDFTPPPQCGFVRPDGSRCARASITPPDDEPGYCRRHQWVVAQQNGGSA